MNAQAGDLAQIWRSVADLTNPTVVRACIRIEASFKGWIARRRAKKMMDWNLRVRNQNLWLGQSGQTRQAYALQLAAKKQQEAEEAGGQGNMPRRGKYLFDTACFTDAAGPSENHVGRIIPGYTGHVPARIDNVGMTFGHGAPRSFEAYQQMAAASAPAGEDDYVQTLDSERAERRRSTRPAVTGESSQYRNGRLFTPAWRVADEEGDEAQRQLRYLGTHARAPFGVDRTDTVEGKVYYRSIASSGPGAWYAQKLRQERRVQMDNTLAAALKHGREQHARAGGKRRLPCLTAAPHLPAWGLPGLWSLRRTLERRQNCSEARRGPRSSPPAAPRS